ncbi:MAG: amidohydrolase family protein [Gemmiger sp.]
MITDTNVYWVPQALFTDKTFRDAFLRSLPAEYDCRGFYELDDSGKGVFRIEKPFGCPNLDYFEADYALEKQLADMDAAGVDRAVMKLPCMQEWIDLALCRQFNDLAAAFAAASGGRMAALAVVPPRGDEECLAELDRCIKDLGMHGVQVSAHYGKHYLDSPIFRDFFRHVNELNIPVYVHHTPLPVDYDSLLDYNNLRRSYGRCVDQVTAVARELFSGMFDELPNLKMIHSMMGGGFFAYTNLFFPTDSGHGRFQATNGKVKEQLKNNIYFETSHSQPWGKEQLELAVKAVGADHILYGSSYPVKMVWMNGGPAFVQALDISEEDKALILNGNAERLYRL